LVLLVLMTAVLLTGCADPETVLLASGDRRAWLNSPGGELPFGLEVSRDGAELEVVIINGSERIGVSRVEANGTELVLGIDHYDSTIVASEAATDASIVGLAFEMTGDASRDTEQVRRYADYHQVKFPLLLAGVSDKVAASKAFPLIDRVRAYPTTVFLDHAGVVKAVHSGFSGPATGEAHEELKRQFESLIEELLDDDQAES
jgi:hypothetical protein